MKISQLLSPERVVIGADVSSKKRLLEQLADLLVSGDPALESAEVFNSLLARERLGATALGHGVALPHGRLCGLDNTLAAFIHARQGVDFDAPDDRGVDLVFALAVPEQAADEHLELLAQLAGLCRDPEQREALRAAQSSEDLIAVIARWEAQQA